MTIQIYTAPTSEPVTLQELKEHLVIDSGTMEDETGLLVCVPSSSHDTTVGYGLLGTAINVLDKDALVYVVPVENGAGGTVDIKIQDSHDATVWNDVLSFIQITEANDTVVQEKSYSGGKKYIRVICKVLVAASNFGVQVATKAYPNQEDNLLEGILKAARMHVESIMSRQIMTATWDYFLDKWPDSDRIKIPNGNLQSVTHVKYLDSDGIETTLAAGTDYIVGKNGPGCGFIVLPYGTSWPADLLYAFNPVQIRFVCGWESAADVPEPIKIAIKKAASDLYERRNASTEKLMHEDPFLTMILAEHRLYDRGF